MAYTASKAAVASVAKNLSKSLAPDGILVNAVCPGSIVTASFTENLSEIFAAEGLDPSDPHDVMKWIDQTFHQPADLGRAGLPDEVASLTAYLVSRRNGYVTGACQREGECASRALWLRLKQSIDAVLSQTTLAELVANPHPWLQAYFHGPRSRAAGVAAPA